MESKSKIIKTGKTNIVFSHANAYTPEVYRKFFSFLDVDATIHAPPHRPLWDPKPKNISDWSIFRDDVMDYMYENSLSKTIGIGHSLGAVSLWMASIKDPNLFSSLILIDPVILPKDVVRLIKYLPYALKKRIRPVIKIAAKRKNRWANRKEAYDYLLAKKVFKRFDSDVYNDFIEYGMRDAEEGVKLSYPRGWEARVYASAQNTWSLMKQSTVPITIIKAQFSNVIDEATWENVKKALPNANLLTMQGVGHLMPFEKPKESAEIVSQILKSKEN